MNIWQNIDTDITVPVNLMSLIDDTDFKTIESAVAYNAAGMALFWNFQTTAGIRTKIAVIPTTGGGDYDWTNLSDGMYKIKMPASEGASINNDTEGFGWFTGICDGVLAWRGPVMGFRAVALNNSLINSGESLATQAAVDAIKQVNILSATGYVKNIYWASGGKYFVKESEDVDIPFGFEGNPTGLKLWFVIGKDLKNAPLVTKELIEGVDWNVVDVDGVDTVEGVIPFIYADTDTLHGKYSAAAIVKTSDTEAYTGWESLLLVERPVSRAEDLV
jgi:hypothetical protein